MIENYFINPPMIDRQINSGNELPGTYGEVRSGRGRGMAATALRAEGDSTPGSDGGERITRLFPKCRPKGVHHHDRIGSGVETRLEANNSVSSDEERRERDPQLLILNAKGGPYKLRDSRIIEIAGGRELYSQSRTKAVRKLRHSTHKHNLRNKARVLTHDIDHSTHKSGISIHRINNEPKKMVSRHTSPTYTNGDTLESSLAIPRNSSPILDPHKTNDVSAKSSPIAVVADGEVVVFDDNEDWKGLRLDADASDNDIDATVRRTLDNIKNGDSDVMNNKNEISGSESSASREEGGCGVWASGDEERARVRVIGELPIAEYEGSPRRYGVGTQPANQSTARSPRPGFPQRVVTESREPTPPSSSTAFDYLYEFSETRKVLEEFFRCPTVAANALPAANNDEIVNFQELDYELRRQSGDCRSDNDAEGSEGEWAAPDNLDSPHTTHNLTNFLGLQQQIELYTEPNMAELTVGTAWSGSASPAPAPANASTVAVVRRERTQIALSPETSDCDSHGELDSDLSLMLMENELSELKG
ncbi:hypothetical protein EVAR_25927_1 [Eumeta japonica]|uniref:Uncharacterized protein n=1 Tax=Eumeta variegata TaxID=151549 RepID=A0A4C1W2D4_EUMVA|nr:hypothetical protein EVAR_25927_1 [Eumeta japonica]